MAANMALLTFPQQQIQRIALHALLQPEVLKRLADDIDEEVPSYSDEDLGNLVVLLDALQA